MVMKGRTSILPRRRSRFRNSARTSLYHEISTSLKERLASGLYPRGHYLPSERALAEEFGVNRLSVRRAISLLANQGLVQVLPNRGALICDTPKKEGQANKSRETGLIALILPFTAKTTIAAQTVSGCNSVFTRHGLHLILHDTSSVSVLEQLRQERAFLRSLLEREVDGALVYFSGEEWNLDLLQQVISAGIPVVLLDRDAPGVDCDTVMLDNETGGYLATTHLIELGHRRIAHISGPWGVSPVWERRAGYRRALEEHGIDFHEELVHCHSEDVEKSTAAAVAAFFSSPQPPTAIFAVSDIHACYTWAALEKAGLTVPEDVALVGFNNLTFGEAVEIGRTDHLTTIDQPFENIAATAARLLLKRICEGRGEACETIRLPARLVVRDSSGSPRARF